MKEACVGQEGAGAFGGCVHSGSLHVSLHALAHSAAQVGAALTEAHLVAQHGDVAQVEVRQRIGGQYAV